MVSGNLRRLGPDRVPDVAEERPGEHGLTRPRFPSSGCPRAVAPPPARPATLVGSDGRPRSARRATARALPLARRRDGAPYHTLCEVARHLICRALHEIKCAYQLK